MRRRTGSVALAAALVASTPTILTAGLVWQESAPPEAPAPAEGIRFNFKDVPYEQVLDYFSRRSGLPIIVEAPVPTAAMTFISEQPYSFDDALTILNLNLRAHDRQLRSEGEFLYLATVAESARKPTRVVDRDALGDVPLDEFVTATFPLQNAAAEKVAEQIAPLIGPNGKVTAVPTQNMLVVVESGPQAERIGEIIDAIDRVRPIDSDVRLFPLAHAEADAVADALKGLVGQKIQRIIIDKDGKQRTVEENDIGGVSMQPDKRTNSVVVVGPKGRIDMVEELIALLDVPEGATDDRQMMTFTLGEITPDAAAQQLTKLFGSSSKRTKPTVLPLSESGKVTVIGQPGDLTQAASLLAELDPDLGDLASGERVTRSIRLGSGNTAGVLDAATKLLSDRQRRSLRTTATLDGKGVLVSGSPDDVDVFEQIVAQVDSRGAGRFRVLDIDTPNPEATVGVAEQIFRRRGGELPAGAGDQVQTEYDAVSGSVIVSGPELGVDLYVESLEQARKLTPPARTTRIIDVRQAEAADIIAPLTELLETADSVDPTREVAPPGLRVIERTNSLIVTAEPAQHTLIEQYVSRLDTLEQTDLPPLRLLQVRSADSVAIAAMLNEQYRKRPQMDRTARPVDVRADASTNTLIVSAHEELYEEIKSFVDDLNTGLEDGPERMTVLFQLKVAQAEAVARAMDHLYPEPPIPLDRRGNPMPWLREPKEVTVSADPSSNSLIIDAPADRIDSLQELAAKLDRVELPPVASLRTYRILGAELQSISTTLNSLARQGNLSAPAEPGKQAVQVVIETEPRSGTLIVAGDDTTFERVESLITELSAAPEARELRVLPMLNADASALAQTVNDVFADERATEPPTVRVDAASNALVVRATPDQLAEIEQLADSVDEAARASSRHVRMIQVDRSRADATLMAETIQRLLEQRGGVKVEVLRAEDLLEQEPQSLNIPTRSLTLPEMIVGVAIAQVAEDEPGIEPDITIAVDPATNSLVVVGPSRLTERVRQLAEELEQRMPPEPTKVRIVELSKSSNARSITNIINQTIRQIGYQSDANPTGFTSRVTIAPDPAGTAVIVWANDTDFETIGPLIGQIDAGETKAMPVRSIKLERADASRRSRRALQRVLRRSQRAPPSGRRGVGARTGDAAISGDRGKSGTLVVAASRRRLRAAPGASPRPVRRAGRGPSSCSFQDHPARARARVRTSPTRCTAHRVRAAAAASGMYGRNDAGRDRRTRAASRTNRAHQQLGPGGSASGEILDTLETRHPAARPADQADDRTQRIVTAVDAGARRRPERAAARLIDRDDDTASPDWQSVEGPRPRAACSAEVDREPDARSCSIGRRAPRRPRPSGVRPPSSLQADATGGPIRRRRASSSQHARGRPRRGQPDAGSTTGRARAEGRLARHGPWSIVGSRRGQRDHARQRAP
jgi:type II secretory pathway component GspD/PulD (secretin)